MKVLHVGEYVMGGVATYIKEIVSYQVKCTEINQVHLLISNKSSEIDIQANHLYVRYYDYKRNLKYIMKALLEVKRYIDDIQPDIIHCHSTFAGVFVRLLYLFKKRRVKIVYCSHGWSFLMEMSKMRKMIYCTIERILSLKTDLIINISKYEYQKSIEFGISEKKSVVIYNGVNGDNVVSEKNPFVGDKEKINLLYVGRFDKQKGIDILLKAFKNQVFSNIQLYLVGDAVLKNVKFSVPSNIIQLGWIDNRSLNAYYQAVDAVIIPSRWEGFGLVAIEAMKNKKAVIASNRGALPEIVLDKVNGFIFDLDAINSLVEILKCVTKDELSIMGEKGYGIFLDKFTSDEMNKLIIDKYVELYKSM